MMVLIRIQFLSTHIKRPEIIVGFEFQVGKSSYLQRINGFYLKSTRMAYFVVFWI